MWHDLIYAARALRATPILAAAMVITIGLGIGASTAIFSVAEAVLLRPLPYPHAERLVVVTGEMRTRGTSDLPLSVPDFLDVSALTKGAFDDLAALYTTRALYPQADGTSEYVRIASVSTNLFAVLGESVAIGRDFVAQDGQSAPAGGAENLDEPWHTATAAILSHEYWQRRYGARREILGTTLPGSAVEIVGVAPPGFEFLFPPALSVERSPDIWFAARLSANESRRATFSHRVVGRLRDGVELDAARAEADVAAAQLRKKFPLWETADFRLGLEPFQKYLVAGAESALLALVGAAICLLLIGCANVANLLLVRHSLRERETAVRAALGGSRWRLMRQMCGEALVVAALGTLLGVALAWSGLRALMLVAPADLPRLDTAGINTVVLLFAVLLGLLAAMMFGLAPAIGGSRADVAAVLRSGGRTAGLRSGRTMCNAVVVTEIALSFVLLIGSGLMLRSYQALLAIDPGFVSEGVLTFRVIAPRLDDPARREARMRDLHQQFASLPGVREVTAASPFPLADRFYAIRWGTDEALADPTLFQSAHYQAVLPGYFETLGTRLLAGRRFTDTDNRVDANGVIIDGTLAAKAFPDTSPLGRRLLIRIRTPEPEWVEVVGVIAHQRATSLAEVGREQIYFTDGFLGHGSATRWAVRVEGDASRYEGAIRAAAARTTGGMVIADLQAMDAFVSRAQAPTRFALLLISVLGATALLLAIVGIHGVLSSVVRQRTTEMGVRLAVGASPGAIRGLVLRQGLMLGSAGVALGSLVALSVTRVMTSLLVGIDATDPVTFVTMIGVFLMVVVGVSWSPARRAARLDPAVALRSE